MKRLLAVALFALGMTYATYAQEQAAASPETNRNVAPDFGQTSAASAPLAPLGNAPAASLSPADRTFGSWSFSSRLSVPSPSPLFAGTNAFAPSPSGASVAPLSDPSPASPPPRFNYVGREYRLQVSLGFAFVRFRSSVYEASAPGLNTSVSYFFKDWLAVEGGIKAAFAPTIFLNEHVKYLGYGAGPRFIWSRGRWEPWAHAILGGAHVLPKTGLGGKNAFAVQVGPGVDYNLTPRVAVRLGADWLRTNFFGTSQNSAQATLGFVYNF
jgi:outer membrane protein with beta-barrel domain